MFISGMQVVFFFEGLEKANKNGMHSWTKTFTRTLSKSRQELKSLIINMKSIKFWQLIIEAIKIV